MGLSEDFIFKFLVTGHVTSPPPKKNWGIFEKGTGEKNDCFSILKMIPKFQTCIITCTIVIKIYTNPSD